MISNIQKNHVLKCMNNIEYYAVPGLDVIHQEMLRLLQIIDKIASSNNITYWIDGGSLIGVIRHKGFIPWDDDLDISMLKSDYLKLIGLLKEYTQKHDDAFLFFDVPQRYHVCNYFASKKIFSRTEKSAILVPVKIDIKPVNCIEDIETNIDDNNKKRDIANSLIYHKSNGFVSEELLKSVESADFFYRYNYEYGLSEPTSTTRLVHPYFEFSSQKGFKSDDVFPIIKHPFQSIEVPVPSGYDKLLKDIYGDYMSLPKLENRAPVACKVYIKQFSDRFYKYVSKMFVVQKYGFIDKIVNNILIIRALGVSEYIKCRFYE